MELTEEHYEILKKCRESGSVHFCWDKNYRHDKNVIYLEKSNFIEFTDKEYHVLGIEPSLKAFNAIITDRGKKILADYEQPQIDLMMRVEALSEQKEAKELMREILTTTLRAEESAKKANIENSKNKKWVVLSAIAAVVSALTAIILLFC